MIRHSGLIMTCIVAGIVAIAVLVGLTRAEAFARRMRIEKSSEPSAGHGGVTVLYKMEVLPIYHNKATPPPWLVKGAR